MRYSRQLVLAAHGGAAVPAAVPVRAAAGAGVERQPAAAPRRVRAPQPRGQVRGERARAARRAAALTAAHDRLLGPSRNRVRLC